MELLIKEEGKTTAIISYIFFIGLIIAFIMNYNKKNEFAKFHIEQSFRIFILSVLLSIALRIVISMTGIVFLSYVGYIPYILMVLGVINAMNLKAEPLPVIGTIGQ